MKPRMRQIARLKNHLHELVSYDLQFQPADLNARLKKDFYR